MNDNESVWYPTEEALCTNLRPSAPTWRQRTGEGEDENRPSHTCVNNNNKLTTKKDFWKGVLGAPNTALTQKPLAYKGQVRKKKSKKSGK